MAGPRPDHRRSDHDWHGARLRVLDGCRREPVELDAPARGDGSGDGSDTSSGRLVRRARVRAVRLLGTALAGALLMAVVDLELDSIGRGSVRINGQELSGAVRRLQVTAEAGQLTRIQLELVQIQAVTRYDAD